MNFLIRMVSAIDWAAILFVVTVPTALFALACGVIAIVDRIDQKIDLMVNKWLKERQKNER